MSSNSINYDLEYERKCAYIFMSIHLLRLWNLAKGSRIFMKTHFDADFESYVDSRSFIGVTSWLFSYSGCATCQGLDQPMQASRVNRDLAVCKSLWWIGENHWRQQWHNWSDKVDRQADQSTQTTVPSCWNLNEMTSIFPSKKNISLTLNEHSLFHGRRISLGLHKYIVQGGTGENSKSCGHFLWQGATFMRPNPN